MRHEKLSEMGVEELRASNFGERLRRMREERLPGEVGREEMVRRLWACGLEDDATAYSKIESGIALPRDAGRFFDITVAVLRLEGAWREALLMRLAFDLLREESGEPVALFVFGAIAG